MDLFVHVVVNINNIIISIRIFIIATVNNLSGVLNIFVIMIVICGIKILFIMHQSPWSFSLQIYFRNICNRVYSAIMWDNKTIKSGKRSVLGSDLSEE